MVEESKPVQMSVFGKRLTWFATSLTVSAAFGLVAAVLRPESMATVAGAFAVGTVVGLSALRPADK